MLLHTSLLRTLWCTVALLEVYIMPTGEAHLHAFPPVVDGSAAHVYLPLLRFLRAICCCFCAIGFACSADDTRCLQQAMPGSCEYCSVVALRCRMKMKPCTSGI
jgi:hypothetical protein